ncbi:MAG TPA: TRAP transporter substrate-binding protein DctP, partial [Spirochaetales bacterium]|nr:TRAP transporter substrate-binding protein DctP [Spirochaetales bacterium]
FLDKDWLLFSMPSVVQTSEEFKVAMEAALPLLRARVADRYDIITVAQGGWLRLFSNRSLMEPENLVSARIGVSAKQEELASQLQSLGARTVKSDASSMLTHFSNGSIDISYSSPLYVKLLWSQFRSSISYMSSFRLSPFFGALVFTKRAWASVPADIKPALIAAADKVATEIATQAIALEEEAIAAMMKDGLKRRL